MTINKQRLQTELFVIILLYSIKRRMIHQITHV